MILIDLKEELHRQGCSCVICSSSGRVESFTQRGVADLLYLLQTEEKKLKGAMVADKVVGKAAAALMIVGGVSRVYADVISKPALNLFAQNNVEVHYGELVDMIINRSKTDFCPMEKLCLDIPTAQQCYPQIVLLAEKLKSKS